MSESYEGRQIVGMDLHRRRSVLVRMTETGERLETVRISNRPVPARRHHRGQAGQVGGPPFRQPMRGRRQLPVRGWGSGRHGCARCGVRWFGLGTHFSAPTAIKPLGATRRAATSRSSR